MRAGLGQPGEGKAEGREPLLLSAGGVGGTEPDPLQRGTVAG